MVLINNAPSRFFRASRGLGQGFPLAPFLFLIVVEALRKLIEDARIKGDLYGVVAGQEKNSHLLFVDDVTCFINGTLKDITSLHGVLDLYCRATCMEINVDKHCLILNDLPNNFAQQIGGLLPFTRKDLQYEFKYLRFILKPNNYRFTNWIWLYNKVG
jgi:hypothetical protein